MITTLTKQQLAFILDIKAEEARAKMCVAFAKSKGIENEAFINIKNKVEDPYPQAMEISMLAEQLNIPTLQESVNDINENYLVRPATKKWILCDYPEKTIKSLSEAGKPLKITIPPALRSLLPEKTCQTIRLEWQSRYAQQKVIV